MTTPTSSKAIKVSRYYDYHVDNPFDRVRGFIDKDGVLCFMSMGNYIDECAKPKNRFTPTVFESVAPKVCIAASFILICIIIGLR